MAKNIIKSPPTPAQPQEASGLAVWLNSFSPFRRMTGDKFPVHYIDGAMWMLLIGLVLIGCEHNAERQMRQIRKKKEEIDNLRSVYTIVKSNFMKQGKQSELIPQVERMGLIESRTAPNRIVIKAEEK